MAGAKRENLQVTTTGLSVTSYTVSKEQNKSLQCKYAKKVSNFYYLNKTYFPLDSCGGLWDVYSMVTGVMGDLLSYIRLFALGVSSAILGYVFNDLAMQMSGDIPVLSQLIFVIILLVGHGLNIFMASLGAFVHPMRLTFVEFYKNAGFKGGGRSYNPFRNKEVETESKII